MMPTSSVWSQLCTPMLVLLHISSLCSFPLHTISPRTILLLPPPKLERNDASKSKENRTNTLGGCQNEAWCRGTLYIVGYRILEVGSPSCLHTTTAASLFQSSSHTVPHSASLQNSTRPLLLSNPSTKRTSPSSQTYGPTEKQDGLRARWRRRATIYCFRKKSWYSDLTRGLVE